MSKILRSEQVARVEGHGGIEVEIDGSRVGEVRVHIFEGMRLFEDLLVGRSFEEVTPIVSRICAICSAGHTTTSLLAIEKAFGVEVPPQTKLLRELLFLGQMVESHALHVFALAVPDYLGFSGIIPLAQAQPEMAALGLRVKKLGNAIQTLVGGRAIHPVNAVVGGFGKLPSVEELKDLRRELEEILAEMLLIGEFLQKSLTSQEHQHIPEDPGRLYAALVPEGQGFGFFGSTIELSNGDRIPVDEYRKVCQEDKVPHSNAKHSRYNGKPFMVGSLARLNIFGERLKGYETLRGFLDLFPSTDPMANNLAQGVELFYSLIRVEEIVAGLIRDGVRPEKPVAFKPKAGTGTAATEVPRGTLYHNYTFDAKGVITRADVVTPTAQNLADMEESVRATCQHLLGKMPEDQILHRLEMVVRAYDPCISCSVHLIHKKTGR